MKRLLLILLFASPVFARAYLPSVDYASMFFQTVQSQPIRKVSALPATCTTVGSAASSNAVLYQGRVYQCTATDTWTATLVSGALPALSNLSSVAINTTLLPGTNNTIDLGSTAKWFRDAYLGTSASFYSRFVVTPTANRTITFPDATITVAGSASALTSGRLPFATTGGLLTDSANALLDSSGYLQAARYYFSAAGTSGSFILQGSTGSLTIQALAVGGADGDIVMQPASGRGAYYNYSSGDWVAFGNGAGASKTIFYQGDRVTIGASGLVASTAQVDLLVGSSSRVGLILKGASSQSANLAEHQNNAGTVLSGIDAAGRFYAPTALTAATVGAAGGASLLPVTPTGYLLINVNGTQMKVPYYSN